MLRISLEFCRNQPKGLRDIHFFLSAAITLAVAELYEEKPFLIAGGPAQGDVVVTKVGAREEEQEGEGVEKVEDREKERKIELEVDVEGDSSKVDLNSKTEMDKVGRDVEAGKKDSMDEKERGPAVVQEGEQPQGAAR